MTSSNKPPLAYLGISERNPPDVTFATRFPVPSDYKQWVVSDVWIDTLAQEAYMCVGRTATTATWVGMAGVGGVESITGNAGGLVFPDIAENINLVGTATNGINVVGNPATSTLTVSLQSPYSDGNFTFSNNAAATPRLVSIDNNDGDPGSSATLDIQTLAAGGDPFILFTVSPATRYFALGIDNSDNDLLKLVHNVDPSSGGVIFAVDPGADTFTFYYQNLTQTQANIGGNVAIHSFNTDNTNIASHAFFDVASGGAGGGDPYIHFIVTGAQGYSLGIDNSVAGDPFKITDGASPSAGTDLFTMTVAGVITLNNDLDVTEGGTGVSTLTSHGILMGNGAGDIQATAEPTDGQILIGDTGGFPILGSIASAAGTIVVTPGAGTINLEVGAGVATTYTAEDASTCSPALNNLTITGTATNGINTTAAGSTMTIAMASPYSDGDFTFTSAVATVDRTVTISNTDDTANASPAHLQVTVGGSINTGDPYVNFLVTAAGTYSLGIDNTVAGDPFKITASASPSAGTDLFTMTNAGVITLANDLDVTEGGTGVSTLTSHGILMGNGAGDINATAEPTNGQVLIGSTGNFPVLATITAGAGINVASGAGSITISSTGAMSFWQTIDASQALAIDNGYICIAAGGGPAAISLSLPAASSVGDIIEIVLDGATSWTVTQAAGQQIRMGMFETTAGVGGSLASTQQGDYIYLVCRTANTRWVVCGSVGNITIV